MKILLSVALLGLTAAGLRAAASPIAVTGANADLVWESGGSATPFDFPNGYAYAGNDIFYSGGYGNPGVAQSFTSAADPSVAFSLLGSFSQFNALQLAGGQSGTLTLTTPEAFSSIYLLTASAHGSAVGDVTINFTDATTLTLSFASADWFTATPADGSSIAWIPEIPGGSSVRVKTTDGVSYLSGSAAPYIYSFLLEIPEALWGKSIESLTFETQAGGANLSTAIFGLSGDLAVVPEPSSAVLLTAGLVALFYQIRRRGSA